MAQGGRVGTTVCGVAVLLLIEDDAKIRTAMMRALTDVVMRSLRSRPAWRDSGTPSTSVPISWSSTSACPTSTARRCCGCCAPSARCRSSSRPPVTTTGAVVTALDAGADDYVVKPFSADQLDARIRAVLRRTSTRRRRRRRFTVGELDVDRRSRTAVLAGSELDLRPREFDLLAYLVARPGEVVSKRTLLAEVWQSPYGGADKTVDVHLSWLRRKLGETAAEPRLLHSVRGVGVKLVEPG